jgi:hypothetical protein
MKKIPVTTNAKCKQYGTTIRSCACVDKSRKNGSYLLNGLHVCKHQAHVINRALEIFKENETTQAHCSSGKAFCMCRSFLKSPVSTCAHIELQKKINMLTLRYLALDLRAAEQAPEVSDQELVERLQVCF